MPKKSKDFEITKESGITIKEEPFFPEAEMPAISKLKEVHLESKDWGNCQRLTLEFKRQNLSNARLFADFYRHETAQEVSAKLILMISEIHRQCIEKIGLKSED